MSDRTSMTVDELAKKVRDSAGAEAEARWKAKEEAESRNREAHTAYLEAARMGELVREDRAAERHADYVRLNTELIEECRRQSDALVRIAAALERARP